MGIILGINHTEKCNSIFAVITDILMNFCYNGNKKPSRLGGVKVYLRVPHKLIRLPSSSVCPIAM